jgi:anti-sigma factor (TIGR02949 family)
MPDDIRSIDCRTAVSHLWDFLDAELDDQRMREVERHLEECGDCLPHADFGRRFLEALKGARQRNLMPPALRAHVLAALVADGFLQSGSGRVDIGGGGI